MFVTSVHGPGNDEHMVNVEAKFSDLFLGGGGFGGD